MLRSMTGYGRGEAAASGVTVVVELKSVNNRFRDVQLRCPREYLPLELRIQGMFKDPFKRGRIEAYVRRVSAGGSAAVVTNQGLAREYLRAVQKLSSLIEDGTPTSVPLDWVLAQPGVIEVAEIEVDVMAEWPVLETAIESAVADLLAMREVEGRSLEEDLVSNLDEFRLRLAEVEAAAVGINDRLRRRLESRIAKLLGDRFDAYRILQEAAIQSDKADISEEITRLRSHCEQFASAFDQEEPVGRRLDFLLQEMNREVNTIGSKSVDHPVSQRVVEMKAILERMREQAANVE